jgi:hypothetical protein
MVWFFYLICFVFARLCFIVDACREVEVLRSKFLVWVKFFVVVGVFDVEVVVNIRKW